jgi:formate dehydrogenase subunit beta
MEIVWALLTGGDPLATVQRFLHDLWMQAKIEGMIIQLDPDGGVAPKETELPVSSLTYDPQQVLSCNPFLPVVPVNTARLVAETAKTVGEKRLGVILRPCEARALHRLQDITHFDFQNWLLIGVDCLGSYSVEDYAWRLEKAGSAQHLTRQELRNARQGGISPDRYRPACQMCLAAEVPDLDIRIGILGMQVKDGILISVKNEEMAKRLGLERITDGLAPTSLVKQHACMLEFIRERRNRFQGRAIDGLPVGLPEDMENLLVHLEHCAALNVERGGPCQACLEVCPVYGRDWQPGGDDTPAYWNTVEAWLSSCAGCGMCEQACPDHLPLAAIHRRISLEIVPSAAC